MTHATLKATIREFENKQRTRHHFEAGEDNYQHIINTSQLLVAVIKGLFTYLLEILALEKKEGTLEHIIPIPNQIKNIYFSIITDHDYVIKFRDSYVPTDKPTLINCKQISEYKVCK